MFSIKFKLLIHLILALLFAASFYFLAVNFQKTTEFCQFRQVKIIEDKSIDTQKRYIIRDINDGLYLDYAIAVEDFTVDSINGCFICRTQMTRNWWNELKQPVTVSAFMLRKEESIQDFYEKYYQ